jgi:hypothetical protein
MENTQELLRLPPYTMCSVSVKCKPDYANQRNGYWSDIVSKDFRSQEAGEYINAFGSLFKKLARARILIRLAIESLECKHLERSAK